MIRRLWLLLLLLWVPRAATAAEDELIEHVVVRNRLFDVGGRLELSPSVGVMLMTRLTPTLGDSSSRPPT